MNTCSIDPLNHQRFSLIPTLYGFPNLEPQSVSPAGQILKFPRPTQQLHEGNMSPLTLASEGKGNGSALDSPSSTSSHPLTSIRADSKRSSRLALFMDSLRRTSRPCSSRKPTPTSPRQLLDQALATPEQVRGIYIGRIPQCR
jgi:hypothetical protein